jgi:hypothetical protein
MNDKDEERLCSTPAPEAGRAGSIVHFAHWSDGFSVSVVFKLNDLDTGC